VAYNNNQESFKVAPSRPFLLAGEKEIPAATLLHTCEGINRITIN